MLGKFALRDAAIIALALAAWRWIAPASAHPGFVGDLTGLVAGLLAGITGPLLHEWGHLAGAVVTGSRVGPGAHLGSPFIFGFDARQNSVRQFLVMSLGGFLVTGLAVWACYALLPDELLASRVARGVAMLLAVAGVVLELPLVVAALVTRSIPAPADVTRRQRDAATPD